MKAQWKRMCMAVVGVMLLTLTANFAAAQSSAVTVSFVTLTAPHAVQWLSDNGPQYTATAMVLYGHELGLVPITTPAYSPESNGLADAFVATFKRDYVSGARTAGCRDGLGAAGRVVRRLQHAGAALGAQDAQPGRLPGRAAHAKLRAVSREMGSTPSH